MSDQPLTLAVFEQFQRRLFASLDIRFAKNDARFDGIDVRFDRTDGRLDGIDARLEGLDRRLDVFIKEALKKLEAGAGQT